MSIELHDPTFDQHESLSFVDRLALRVINDVRDLPFIRLTILLTLVVAPVTVYFYRSGQFNWWMAAGYWALIFGALLGPYILMLHNISHRPLFKQEYRWMAHYIGWILGPYFGQTPNTYYVHHIGMHHSENNLEDDLSCTMPYQRDSLFDFLCYAGRFYTIGAVELGVYLWRHRRFRLFRRMIIGELSYLALVVVLLCFNWQATVTLFVVPVIVGRFAMMAGNWGQHAFIDASDPGNLFRSSITCINSVYNRRCFNDGYHIGHHLNPSRHWTEMPGDFLRSRERYTSEDAIIFEKIDFFIIWGLLMLKRYDWLARYYVPLSATPPEKETIIATLKQRTQRIVRQFPDRISAL